MTGAALKRSMSRRGRAAGSKATSFASGPGLSKPFVLPFATSRQNADVPAVSATRWMRASAAGFSTRCSRQLSKIQASPAPMCTLSPAQWNRTSGRVTTGMCTRTRWNQ